MLELVLAEARERDIQRESRQRASRPSLPRVETKPRHATSHARRRWRLRSAQLLHHLATALEAGR